MSEDDVIRVLPADPDSHFRLKNCPTCQGDNVAYVLHKGEGEEYWQCECADCGRIGMPGATRHGAQLNWNEGADK